MSNPYLSDVFEDVSEEGQRAREKFGAQSDSTDERWLAILMEEAGEAATEVLRCGNPELDALLKRSAQTGVPLDAEDIDPAIRLRKEIVQVTAVAMRWVQSLDTRRRAGCGFPSSVSDARCVLPPNHPADSATRFHRFAVPALGDSR